MQRTTCHTLKHVLLHRHTESRGNVEGERREICGSCRNCDSCVTYVTAVSYHHRSTPSINPTAILLLFLHLWRHKQLIYLMPIPPNHRVFCSLGGLETATPPTSC